MIGTLSHGKNLAEERWLDDGLQKHYTLDLDNPICVLLHFFWKTWPKAQLAPFFHIYYREATHTCYQRYLLRWIEDFVRVRETETIPFKLHFSKPLDIVVVNNWEQYFVKRYQVTTFPQNTRKKHRNCLWYDVYDVFGNCRLRAWQLSTPPIDVNVTTAHSGAASITHQLQVYESDNLSLWFPQFDDGSRIFFLTMRRVKSYVPRDVTRKN